MEAFLKENRQFVVPGDVIVNSIDYLPGRNCFREGDSIVAKKLGIVSVLNRVVSVIPLNSAYIPKVNDMVIARVTDIQSNGWILYVSPICNAFLSLSGVREYIDTSKTSLSRYYAIGDLLYAKVSAVNNLDSVYITMQDIKCKKLHGGRIVKINTAKIPRLIGKEGSMINMIKTRTNTRIYIGQNGLLWMEGEKQEVVIDIVNMIEAEPFAEGLTDRVAKKLGGAPLGTGLEAEMDDMESAEKGNLADYTEKGDGYDKG